MKQNLPTLLSYNCDSTFYPTNATTTQTVQINITDNLDQATLDAHNIMILVYIPNQKMGTDICSIITSFRMETLLAIRVALVVIHVMGSSYNRVGQSGGVLPTKMITKLLNQLTPQLGITRTIVGQ